VRLWGLVLGGRVKKSLRSQKGQFTWRQKTRRGDKSVQTLHFRVFGVLLDIQKKKKLAAVWGGVDAICLCLLRSLLHFSKKTIILRRFISFLPSHHPTLLLF
jgi:hypothetical protein